MTTKRRKRVRETFDTLIIWRKIMPGWQHCLEILRNYLEHWEFRAGDAIRVTVERIKPKKGAGKK